MPRPKKRKPYPLAEETIENHSGFNRNWQACLPFLKRELFYKKKVNVGGDAPKSFIQAYFYGECKKKPRRNWTAYIAKVGHKWYPMESVTEYLLNQIGEVLGLDMAKSRLVLANRQIRFLSKYFLDHKLDEQLTHGAQVYSAYLEDHDFVELANERKAHKESRELFNFQLTEKAIKQVFPDQHAEILEGFVKMLLLDAIVGNNDRHFYNWGVITDIAGKTKPRFSPIYDTARGLFWNEAESRLHFFEQQSKLESYMNKSLPRTGWENMAQINHFQLVEKIFHEDGRYCQICQEILNDETFPKIDRLIDERFSILMSDARLKLIKKCLSLRIERLLSQICK